MHKISAIVIAKNEEAMLTDCLVSLSFCDETIVIDDGSTDKTFEIAKQFTKYVFPTSEKSVGYVEAVRQFAIQKATHEWILFVDADERVSKDLSQSITNMLENPTYSAYTVIRRNFYLGNHPWPTHDILERCFKKEAVKNWKWKLHTSPEISGGTGALSGYLDHYTHQKLSTMVIKTIQWSAVEARLRFEAHHPKMSWWRFPRVMVTGFYEWYIKQKGWKVGSVGIIEGMYQAFSMFVTYAKLWELQERKK